MIGVYPVPMLPDGRKPRISSGYGGLRGWGLTPGKSTHVHLGDDITYPRAAGDGGGQKNISAGSYMPEGVRAIAALPGTVTYAQMGASGLGVTVASSGGVTTRYLHLTKLFVKVGDEVSAGAWLGIIGEDPRVANIKHLHFELLINGKHVDPEPYLARLTMLTAGQVLANQDGVEGGEPGVITAMPRRRIDTNRVQSAAPKLALVGAGILVVAVVAMTAKVM